MGVQCQGCVQGFAELGLKRRSGVSTDPMENVYFGILSHLLIANIALGAVCRIRTKIGQTVSKC